MFALGVQSHQGISGFCHLGSVQRDFWSPDRSQVSGRSAGGGGGAHRGGSTWTRERSALRKTVSVDEQLLQATGDEQTSLERKELRNNQVSPTGYCTQYCTDCSTERSTEHSTTLSTECTYMHIQIHTQYCSQHCVLYSQRISGVFYWWIVFITHV